MNPELDGYFKRAKQWRAELALLREVLADCELTEERKWGKPCYAHDGKNIAIIQPMKGHLCLMFFQGSAMKDPAGLLAFPGPNSRVGKRFEFTSLEHLEGLQAVVKDYVVEAIALAKSGKKLASKPELELVEELRERLDADPDLKAAFEALTPGRQRAYHLHVSGAKQAATRHKRIDKHAPRILAGKGLRD